MSTGASGIPRLSFLTLLPQTSSPNPSRKNVRPIVAIKRVKGGWLTRGRNTTRSMTNARTIITPVVMMSASHTGRPCSMSPTRVRAANSTMTPWAKLNTPEALKMSTKPSATMAYITPAIKPPTTTSAKKIGDDTMSANGATSTARLLSSAMSRFHQYLCIRIRHTQIRIDHGLIGPHRVWRTIGNLATIVEHHEAVRDIHHDPHIVLNEHAGDTELVPNVEDKPAHVSFLFHVHPGHGFIQQKQHRFRRQRPAQLDAFLQPVGQPPHGRFADSFNFQEINDGLDIRPMPLFVSARSAPVECLA